MVSAWSLCSVGPRGCEIIGRRQRIGSFVKMQTSQAHIHPITTTYHSKHPIIPSHSFFLFPLKFSTVFCNHFHLFLLRNPQFSSDSLSVCVCVCVCVGAHTVPGPFDICSGSLRKPAMKFIQQFKALRKSNVCIWRRRKPRRLFSDFNLLTSSSSSSFAAMEVSNQLKQVFKYFDANGDGKISPMELSEVLLSLRQHDDKSTAAKEAEGMVRAMDRDGDGLVDIDEFMKAVMNIDDDDHHTSTAAAEENDLRDAFLIFDSDKNGLISAEELRRVFGNLGYHCTLKECCEMIKGVDKDGDGFVDFKEFRSMMTAGGCIS